MTRQAGAALLGFLFWIHMEHRRNMKPRHLCKSDSNKVAQLNIINKAAEWENSTNPEEAVV